MSDYEPDPQTAKLFARYKQAAEIIRNDKKPVLKAAEEALRQGAKSPELAAMTGMSGQTFRTLAEKIGVDARSKPPTTGPEAEARKSQALPAPTPVPRVATPLLGMSEPPAELGLAAVIAKMSRPAAKILMKPVEAERTDWLTEQRAKFAEVEDRWLTHALLQAAVNAGYVELPAT